MTQYYNIEYKSNGFKQVKLYITKDEYKIYLDLYNKLDAAEKELSKDKKNSTIKRQISNLNSKIKNYGEQIIKIMHLPQDKPLQPLQKISKLVQLQMEII
jgi:hypothetical protein